jgi:16S rRNA (guanine527-N7)-methyltransferase
MVDLLTNEASQIGVHLTKRQADQFQLYAKTLCQWNQKVNLTRIVTDQDIVIKHFIDSMAVIQVISNHTKGSIIDVGSGAGFPGIPLAIILPNATLTLVDASRKRVNFLKYIISIMGLNNVNAYHARIEQFCQQKHHMKHFNVVISRAFSEINRFVHLVRPLVKHKGRIVAMKGINIQEELKTFTIPDDLSLVLKQYTLPLIDQKRYLVCFDVHSGTIKNE